MTCGNGLNLIKPRDSTVTELFRCNRCSEVLEPGDEREVIVASKAHHLCVDCHTDFLKWLRVEEQHE